jgi:hypothetical protein
MHPADAHSDIPLSLCSVSRAMPRVSLGAPFFGVAAPRLRSRSPFRHQPLLPYDSRSRRENRREARAIRSAVVSSQVLHTGSSSSSASEDDRIEALRLEMDRVFGALFDNTD